MPSKTNSQQNDRGHTNMTRGERFKITNNYFSYFVNIIGVVIQSNYNRKKKNKLNLKLCVHLPHR